MLKFTRPCRGLPCLPLLSLFLTSCFRDGGFVDPGKEENLPVLASFQGRAYNEGDSALSSGRFMKLEKPKIALVWQFIGPKEFTWAPSEATVQATPPFNFEMDLRHPPADSVRLGVDLAVGTFWLYSDENANGHLDRLVHPELLAMNYQIDSMYAGVNQALDRLIEVAEVRTPRMEVSETYYIGPGGSVVEMKDGVPDTIWQGGTPAWLKEQVWETILNNRFRILNHYSRWERFFALRKRSNNYFRVIKPAAGFSFAAEFPYERKLFPLPGKEKEFEKRVREATWTLMEFSTRYTVMAGTAIAKKWIDYPFSGFGESSQDWVAGRSRFYTILYVPDRVYFDEMVAAERFSSFSVRGKERLQKGYNLIHCDAQYDCEVMDSRDTIRIDLGESEGYFNPPAAPIVLPPIPPVAGNLKMSIDRFEGAYRYLPFRPLSMKVREGNLWAAVPDLGVFRLRAVDSQLFVATAQDIRFQFVGSGSATEKLLIYHRGNRFVAIADSSLAVPGEHADQILRASARAGAPMAKDDLSAFASAYDFARDTLKVSADAAGDSLLVTVPGMLPHYYRASGNASFFSPQCDCLLSFRRDSEGKVTGLELGRGELKQQAPNIRYVPGAFSSLFPAPVPEPDSLVSESDGSGADRYLALDGKGRYQGSPDGRYLKAGDGWVAVLDHSLPGDSISLSAGSEGILFKLSGLKSVPVGLEIGLRRDRAAKKARVRFRLVGGADPDRLDQVLSEGFWAELPADSSTLVLKPLPVISDPFYLRLERIPTADPAFAIAFDRYRLFARRGGND